MSSALDRKLEDLGPRAGSDIRQLRNLGVDQTFSVTLCPLTCPIYPLEIVTFKGDAIYSCAWKL